MSMFKIIKNSVHTILYLIYREILILVLIYWYQYTFINLLLPQFYCHTLTHFELNDRHWIAVGVGLYTNKNHAYNNKHAHVPAKTLKNTHTLCIICIYAWCC